MNHQADENQPPAPAAMPGNPPAPAAMPGNPPAPAGTDHGLNAWQRWLEAIARGRLALSRFVLNSPK